MDSYPRDVTPAPAGAGAPVASRRRAVLHEPCRKPPRRGDGGEVQLRYIELFHAVLTTGSLTGAAKLLNISQPAASKALQHAEDRLGFALFHRVRGRLQPTEQALALRPRIEGIIQELHHLERLAAGMGRVGAQPLRISCTPALSQSLVPDAVVALREAYPDTGAELFTQHSVVMGESLVLHEADIGLTLQSMNGQNLHQRALCSGQVMVIAPPGWWSGEELAQPLPIRELTGQPLIGITVRDALGSMLHSHLERVDPAPRVSVWVQTYQLAHALVARGQGLALVDPFTARTRGAHGVQRRPVHPRLDVVLQALYRPDTPLDPVQERFLDVVSKIARQLLAQE